MKPLSILVGSLLALCPAFGKGVDSAYITKLNTKAFHFFLSKPDSAIYLANKAIELAGGEYKFQTAYGNYVLSKANWTKANYFLSVVYGFKALKLYENTSRIFHWGETELSLARTFIDLKNFNQAKIHINRASALAKNHNDKRLQAQVFREKSFLFQESGEYDSAIYYSEQGIKLYDEREDKLDISILYGRLARVYLYKKEYERSLGYSRRAIQMDITTNNQRGLSIAYRISAEILNALGKKDSAIYFLNKIIEIEKNVHNLPNLILAHQLLASIYEGRHQTSEVIHNLKMADQLKDTLYQNSHTSQILEILTKYELETKERVIQLLESDRALQLQKSKNQNLVIGIFGVGIILVSMLALLFWRLRQAQSQANKVLVLHNQEIALQNEEIQSQAESMQEISKLKSKLLSVISHDLRGPVANLQSLLELSSQELISSEQFREISGKLKSSLNITQRTLQNLLNWSLSQMEGIRTEPIPFYIDQAVKEVIELSYESADKKQIKIQLEPTESIAVMADIDQVNLILRNLIHNAVKFSKPHGSVNIKLEKQDGLCRVMTKDDGIGMTESEIKILLSENEFFTRAGTQQEKGTGLGFLLCKDFIRRNKGTLSIESKVNHGTQITFTLPLA